MFPLTQSTLSATLKKLYLPVAMGLLSNLENIVMYSNPLLRGSIPESFSKLESLKSIDLMNSGLGGKIPPGLFALPNLRSISFDNNGFTGKIPEFTASPPLKKLHLRNNFFSGSLPPSLMKIQSLSSLNIAGNFLSGSFPAFENSTLSDCVFTQEYGQTNEFCCSMQEIIPPPCILLGCDRSC
eukprot:TRINITY_DN852_c0_g1_i2.p1 TRINITY_DN852_c0_g1~~TRINITY_DN852_c0_g1_i2.p1  ORF type:complete len:183 (+),score=15.82 TRINITY_DN852_c0_g1_i2:434-982(+)